MAITWHSIIGDIIEPYNLYPHEKARIVFKQLNKLSTLNDQWIIFGLNGPAPCAADSLGTSYDPCFRYNVITYLRHDVLWNPQTEKVDSNYFGYTRILVNRDGRRKDFNENQVTTFLNDMTLKLGTFKKNVFILDNDKNSLWYLELYIFQPKMRL